jgi:hypothetical protein
MSVASAEKRIAHCESNETAIHRRERPQDTWSDGAWREAAADYHGKRGERPLVVDTDTQRFARLRRLLNGNVSLKRVWAELNQRNLSDAPQFTIEALVYELRTHGVAALKHPNSLRRLSDVSTAQLIQLRPKYLAITDHLLLTLGEQL